MRCSFCFFLIFLGITGHSQVQNHNFKQHAFLIGSHVSVYNSPINNKCYSIDNSNDDYYHALLVKKKGNRVYVRIRNLSTPDSNYCDGWIDFSNVGIAFNTDTIVVFSSHQSNSHYKKVTISKGSTIACVRDYRNNGWMEVAFYLDNTYYLGWVPPQYLCSNYFTMCCGN